MNPKVELHIAGEATARAEEQAAVVEVPADRETLAATDAVVEVAPGEEPREAAVESAAEAQAIEATADEAAADAAAPPVAGPEEGTADSRPAEQARPAGPRPLPPGWFRATPQMMSLVGCSEPEMANVLAALG